MTETVQVSRNHSPERVRGLDGKSYPKGGARTPEVRDYLIGRVHYLHHDEGLSLRGIVARLRQECPEVAPALGTVSGWMKLRCDGCSGAGNVAPEQC